MGEVELTSPAPSRPGGTAPPRQHITEPRADVRMPLRWKVVVRRGLAFDWKKGLLMRFRMREAKPLGGRHRCEPRARTRARIAHCTVW
eukprot:6407998-Prymnesium_polylepis.2